MRKNLVLLGMMAVGKSTLAKIVAKKQDLEFVDSDTNIENKFSMKIAEIFKKEGEEVNTVSKFFIVVLAFVRVAKINEHIATL